MKILELPYICFGRNKDNITDFYAIKEQSPLIPDEIVTLFRDHIAKSIQWESSEETSKYADCFLIWRVNRSGFLFAKLADGGCDSLQRNHSIQMDAVYLTNEQLPDAAQRKALFFASLCFSSVWEYWEKRRILQPVDESTLQVAEISEKLLEFFSATALPVHSLFLAAHQYFTPCGVDRIVYNIHNDNDLLNTKPIPVEIKPVNYPIPSSEYPLRPTFSLIQYVLSIIIVFLILGMGGMSWTAWQWENKARKLQTDRDSLHIEYIKTEILLAEEKEKSKELEKNLLERINEFNNTKNIADKQLQQIRESVSVIKKLEDEIKKLKKELQDSRQNAEESLKNENESLKDQNEQLNKKIDLIREHLEIIHNELLPEK
ncbi:MAG: hypothetical protein LBG58_15605 [Planctomycetaceae bacterium]|jgi:hypothetical protein|nr:hypothetical protein [Planctomycetaceae bacterium]